MKRTFMMTILLLTAVLAGTLSAHPASKIELSFDKEKHLLKIEVFHDTKDVQKHYIKKISVKLNKEEIIEQSFLSQSSMNSQSVSYVVIDVKPGDTIEVQTMCNVFGKKKASITLEQGGGS